MKTRTVTKTYGVVKAFEKGRTRYFVMCDGYRTRLNFARKRFAEKKSLEFVQRVFRGGFKDINGIEVEFEYIQKEEPSHP